MVRCGSLPISSLFLATLVGCASLPPAEPAVDASLRQLAAWLSGSFSSARQARTQAGFSDVRLHMVQVWPERRDGIFLYVEQAMADNLERPYRQRVYQLVHRGGDLYESRVFEIADPAAVVGGWRDGARLAGLRPEALVPRAGCELVLRRQGDGTFVGSTLARLCPSSHRGAAYATAEVVISATAFVSWDRGFDETGTQVWGAVNGPYRFDKVESYPVADRR